ncbi:MAG: hypothetical protein FJ096_19535, partial [Deltaproteobacteria bacterium]|nr:hypothetical protein [Deltaproteobacteria bacterium]
DQLACVVEDGGAPRLAVVVEVPIHGARAKVAVEGEQGSVESYEVVSSRGLDAEIVAALAANQGATLVDRKIRVSGVSKLHRGENGARGYKMLTDRRMETRLAIKTAEYKKVWVASFERACSDEGLGCKVDDGRPEPKIELLPPEAPAATAGDPSTPPPDKTVGQWEAAARDADPTLQDPGSSHDDPWGKGFFVRLIEKSGRVEGFGDVGKSVRISPWSGEDGPKLLAFRESLAKRGGPATFTCTVRDMGQEINPDPVPLRDAALKAKGLTSKEAPTWIIVCDGDEKSHLGTVAVFVPTDAVWAMLDGTKVTDYHLEPHGLFNSEIRAGLVDIGVGTKLEIAGYPRVARSMLKNTFFRNQYPMPVWRAYFGEFQCGHEGMGCTHLDGLKPEVRVAKDGLVKCPVSTWTYPPN